MRRAGVRIWMILEKMTSKGSMMKTSIELKNDEQICR